MTYSTKERIALALKNLVCRKSFQKITINDIARECNMTRENFYYHFRDKFDIIRFMLETEIVGDEEEDEAFSFWLKRMISAFNADRNVYSRIVNEVGKDAISENFYPVMHTKLRQLLDQYMDQSVWNKRKERLDFIAAFYASAFVEFLFENVIENEITDYEQFDYNLEFLISNFLPFVRYQKEKMIDKVE